MLGENGRQQGSHSTGQCNAKSMVTVHVCIYASLTKQSCRSLDETAHAGHLIEHSKV